MKRPENSFNNSETNKEKELSNEIKEKQAYEEITRRFQEKLTHEEELLHEHPFFHAQGREWKISSAVDCIQAKGQLDLKLAQEVLIEAREKENYWQEKAAAKLVDFFETQQELFSRYAELKAYHGQMAEVVGKQSMSGLEEVFKEAEKLWTDLNKNHEQ
jgi:hypothetical protein